ncbi:MAG: hypothetical protein PF495_12035 [Spirochaetales bacterium]|jgi:hypothetical protein|nr:hypothetical protein [Spirochaetales bacterium]
MFLYLLQQHKKSATTESGFVLVTVLGILVIISLLGSWALRTSVFELRVAGGLLRFERQFNLAEGAGNTEAANVGFFSRPFYALPDPSLEGLLMVPTSDAEFDPGDDTTATLAGIDSTDSDTWPVANLLYDIDQTANEFDYRYLVTYLGYENVMGSSAESFSAYQFRIQGAAPLVVELGGSKLGPKAKINN